MNLSVRGDWLLFASYRENHLLASPFSWSYAVSNEPQPGKSGRQDPATIAAEAGGSHAQHHVREGSVDSRIADRRTVSPSVLCPRLGGARAGDVSGRRVGRGG